MPEVEPIARYLEPIRKSVTVGPSIERAFRLFTTDIGSWWPLDRYSCTLERAASCAIESRVGGGVFETRDDGARFEWGRVLVWHPPERLVMTWHPGRDAAGAQELEVRFTATTAGTRVDLEHRGWDALGADAARFRKGYVEGWDHVLGVRFAGACAAAAGDAR